MRLTALLATLLVFATGALAGEPVDNCGTVLGSLSVELRLARALPPGQRTSYYCARRYNTLVGASRERVLRALGPPDRNTEDGGWSYLFVSRHDAVVPGTPELVFRFGGEGAVEAVDCRRTS
jgi:hypothetical protein